MSVVPGDLGGFQPICNSCGVALCWEISQDEYESNSQYWNGWKCKDCDPQAPGSWLRNRISKKASDEKLEQGYNESNPNKANFLGLNPCQPTSKKVIRPG